MVARSPRMRVRLLLGATDRAIGLIERFAACFTDRRVAGLIEHKVATLVGQRVFGIALGYEDLNDHDELRHDPMMAVLAGKLAARRKDCAPVAGKSTLNRLELGAPEPTRYHKIARAGGDRDAVRRSVPGCARHPPQQIILDLDATDDPLHGHQEGRFFHGYYDCYCYLPLYIFCGRHLLAAKLRRSNIDASRRSGRGDRAHRRSDPRPLAAVRILLRADFGFAREALMAWCENNGVDFLFGLAKNSGWPRRSSRAGAAEEEASPAASRRAATRSSAGRRRDSWSRQRRVVAKAEWTQARPIRALSSPRCAARTPATPPLRGDLLRPRRDGKPHQGVPARPVRRSHLGRHDARQPATAVVCLDGLCAPLRAAPHALPHTQFAEATCGTIRLKLLKIGALVRTSVRRIKFAMASACPYQREFALPTRN